MDRRAFLAATAAFAATPALAQSESLDAALERIRAETGVPALGGAVLTPEMVVWSGETGVQRRGGDQPVQPGSLWHLGSNTKAMTSAVYARLVEQGRAAWDAGLPALFPDIDAAPGWETVSVEQLMGHRSGVRDVAVMPGWMAAAWAGGDVTTLRTRMAQTVLGAAPPEPAGAFSYSNANYILLGAAIERITGDPWEAAVRREVFQPLGMTAVGFGAPPEGPWGHQGPQMTPMNPQQAGSDNPPALGPAGTVHASLESYGRFLQAMLRGGGGWLSAGSVSRLSTPLEGPGQTYALGWGVIEQTWSGGQPALVHDGSNTMWLARAVVAPGRNAAAIAVANAGDPARPAIDALTRALIAAFPA